MEDKQQILDLLLPALQATRQCHDLISLKHEYFGRWDNERVIATFEDGIKSIMVSGDSGIAMIADIVSALNR